MANRSIQQKILKMKRRNRYAKLSGAVSRSKERVGPTPFTEDEQGKTTTGETKMVLVGPISLSKQVINTGRGPDASRMNEYYNRTHSLKKQPLTVAEVFSIADSRYQKMLEDIPAIHGINLVNNQLGRLALFWHETKWFFVDVDNRKKIIKLSTVYETRQYAMAVLKRQTIRWVETFPIK